MSDKPDGNPRVEIQTSDGSMTLELFPDLAPGHVKNFTDLIGKGFYDGSIFHRVIPGFMIQGGCPDGTGTGNPGYNIKAEFNDTPHVLGTLSMARRQDPDSAGCQFFICLGTVPHLNGQYTVFGQLVAGDEALKAIGAAATGANNRPLKPTVMDKVSVISD